MKRFSINESGISDVTVVIRKKISDSRGFLSRIFCSNELKEIGWSTPVVQINQTQTSSKGTVRGMHFQHPPHSENKLITCIKGEIWDVAVDLRHGSPTFMQWHAEYLSASNLKSLFIPKGFAHGFQSVTDNVELLYLHSEPYVPSSEAAINPKDPMLNISWPLTIDQLSDRDQNTAYLPKNYSGIKI